MSTSHPCRRCGSPTWRAGPFCLECTERDLRPLNQPIINRNSESRHNIAVENAGGKPTMAFRRLLNDRQAFGFTLIEILIVVVIVALLLAFMLSGLSGARECGRAAVCLSNDRQIVAAAYGYAQDCREFVPREGYAGGAAAGHPCWAVVLRPYLDASEPSGDGFAYAPYYLDPARRVQDRHAVHFVANGFPFIGAGVVDLRGENARFRRPATQLYRVPFPSSVVYFSDFGDDTSGEVQGDIDGRPAWEGDEGPGQFYDLWAIRHLDPERLGLRRHYGTGAVGACFDGSAKVRPAKEMGDTGVWDDGVR